MSCEPLKILPEFVLPASRPIGHVVKTVYSPVGVLLEKHFCELGPHVIGGPSEKLRIQCGELVLRPIEFLFNIHSLNSAHHVIRGPLLIYRKTYT